MVQELIELKSAFKGLSDEEDEEKELPLEDGSEESGDATDADTPDDDEEEQM